jgi:hypothetical protein
MEAGANALKVLAKVHCNAELSCVLLQHYRDVLRLLQTILNYTRVKDEDYSALLKAVQELQVCRNPYP